MTDNVSPPDSEPGSKNGTCTDPFSMREGLGWRFSSNKWSRSHQHSSDLMHLLWGKGLLMVVYSSKPHEGMGSSTQWDWPWTCSWNSIYSSNSCYSSLMSFDSTLHDMTYRNYLNMSAVQTQVMLTLRKVVEY